MMSNENRIHALALKVSPLLLYGIVTLNKSWFALNGLRFRRYLEWKSR